MEYNHEFSTKDHDRDDNSGVNCGKDYFSGWWHQNCVQANLNGLYLKGVTTEAQASTGMIWETWRGKTYSLKTSQMKFRPIYE